MSRGDLDSIKVGRLRRIPESEVTAYVDRLTAEQNVGR
jgi:excisionase family DNA binding protein